MTTLNPKSYLAAWLLYLLPALSLAEPSLTPATVHGLLDSIEQAVHERDVDAFGRHFTPDATINLDIGLSSGPMQFNLDQYTQMLREGWALPLEYSYQVVDIQISIDDGGQSATVTDLTIEGLGTGDKKLETRTRETMQVILHHGQPKISELTGRPSL